MRQLGLGRKSKFAGPGVALALSIGAVSAAHAVSLSRFDSASLMHQSEYIAATKKSIADHYVQSAPEKFACMVALENTAGIGGANKLNSLIFIEIDRARRDTTKDHQVEDIIFGVTERECTNVD